MKLTTYKPKDSMIRLLIASILFFIPLGGFADEKQREIENEALNLVIKKYGKGLENSLKGTRATPSYRSWYENDCFVSIAAGTCLLYTSPSPRDLSTSRMPSSA